MTHLMMAASAGVEAVYASGLYDLLLGEERHILPEWHMQHHIMPEWHMQLGIESWN
jgi:hypothetical protein